MKYPKFRRDDLVQTQMGTKARVLSFRVENGEHYYTIEFLDGARKGDIVEFKDDYISFYNTNKLNEEELNIPSRCPVCNSEWKVTGFGMKKWYDCPKCNDTAENLIKQCKMDKKSEFIYSDIFAYNVQEALDKWDNYIDRFVKRFEPLTLEDEDDEF